MGRQTATAWNIPTVCGRTTRWGNRPMASGPPARKEAPLGTDLQRFADVQREDGWHIPGEIDPKQEPMTGVE
jgi:hypothetical protein